MIKSLETHYSRIEGVAAATILGDGTVALILDAGGLIRLALSRGGAPVYAAAGIGAARTPGEGAGLH